MDRKTIPASTTKVETIKIVSNEHLNPNNTLFGGELMCWIDEIAFLCARRFSGRKTCVTVGIDNVSFKLAQQLGDHIHLNAQVIHVGISSMVIEVQVECEDVSLNSRAISNRARLTFVALDQKQKPTIVPRLQLDTTESHKKHREIELRNKVKKRLERHLESEMFNMKISNNITQTKILKKQSQSKRPIMAWTHNRLVKKIESLGLVLPDIGAKTLLEY